MKKLILIFSLCICILGLTACENQQQEDVLHLGVNAIITEIDTVSKTITVKDSDDNDVLPYGATTRASEGDTIYLFKNKPLYNLPSAGGSGIFWYLISGTAFLMAASLILYRMKRKEVLGK